MKLKFRVFVLGLAGLLGLLAFTVAYGDENNQTNVDSEMGTDNSPGNEEDESSAGSYFENESTSDSGVTQIVADKDYNDVDTTDSGSGGSDEKGDSEVRDKGDDSTYKEEWKRECARYGIGTAKFYECKSQYVSSHEVGQYVDNENIQLSTDFLSGLEVKPEVGFEVDGAEGVLDGIRRIDVEISEAKSVDVFLRRPGTLIEYFIGTVVYVDSEHGYVSWDTQQTPNGVYEVVARVTNVFGTYESIGPVVDVDNKTEEITEGSDSDSLYWSDEVQEDITRQLKELEDSGELEIRVDAVEAEDIKLMAGVDSDNDGLTDNEELRLGTNRFHPDSDGDGYLDGLEIARGYNPLIPSPGDKVAFTQPGEEIGVVRDDLYIVESAQVEEESGREVLSIRGRARPLAFVVLYIYSEVPTVVTVRADAFGNFEYKLDKIIPDGEHRIYVALTDSNGLIVEKSKPLAFVKEAQAVVVTSDLLKGEVAITAESPVKFSTILLVTVIVVVVAIMLAVIVVFKVVTSKKEEPSLTPPESTG